MKCLNCGKEISGGQNFCKFCGTPVKMQPVTKQTFETCKKCGAPIKDGFSFCDQCGSPVEAENGGADNSKYIGRKKIENKKQNKHTVIILISVFLFFIALIGAGSLVYKTLINSGQNNNKGETSTEAATKIVTSKAEEQSSPAESTFGDTGHLAIIDDSSNTANSSSVNEKNDSNLQDNTEDKTKNESDNDKQESESQEITESGIPKNVDIHMEAITFGGHSYYIFENNCSTWEDAEKDCERRGGYLAVINNKDEDDFLFEYMLRTGRHEAYFGLSDIETEGIWKWVGGRESNYLNWGINDDGEQEPNKANKEERYVEYCADLTQAAGTWNDCEFGRDTTAYICEWDYVR